MTTPTDPTFSIVTHNGTVTIYNPVTDVHRTFQIRTQPDDSNFAPGQRIVSLLIGPDNETDYQGFGFVSYGRIAVWKRHRNTIFDQYARMLEDLQRSCERWGLTVEWAAKCRQCNRKLTTPESLASGIGPVCEGGESS